MHRRVFLAGAAMLTLNAWQPKAPDKSRFYPLWLQQDAAYIITPRERAEFLRLHTDEERAAFIKEFWLRRDPTPGTPRNEFREEHYRRIAYANEHFWGRVPGWKTDRGRIYIVNGPPDQIEPHPKGGPGKAFPFELWRYQRSHLVMEFDDVQSSGDYRLVTR
jgi:GWxTD domain-containing protein